MNQSMTLYYMSIVMLNSGIPAFSTDTPILDFNFREGAGTTITDAANGIVATAHGTVWSTEPNGVRALYFDYAADCRGGDGAYVEIPYHSGLNSPHLTVESWVYPVSTGYYTAFAERILDGGAFQTSIFLGMERTVNTTAAQPVFRLDRTSADVYLGNVISPAEMALNEWHQIVGTYDGSNVHLYIDGEQVAIASAGSPRSTGSTPLYLGHAPTSNHFFNGYYARFRMYDRALTAGEVAHNFVYDGILPTADAGGPYIEHASDWDGALVALDGLDSYEPNAGSLTHEWDLDLLVDSDGDGDSTNDIDDTGAVVLGLFPIGQSHIALVVRNEYGLPSPPEVTAITISFMNVVIDINPGVYPNIINMGASDVIPVAFLTDDRFDAATINPLTVTLRGEDFAGGLVKLRGKKEVRPTASLIDVDGDGDLDLLVQLETQLLSPHAVDALCVLGALTEEGYVISGADTMRVVSE